MLNEYAFFYSYGASMTLFFTKVKHDETYENT